MHTSLGGVCRNTFVEYSLISLQLCTDVLPGQSPWPLLPLRLLSVSKCNCCGGLCHQVHTIHCGSCYLYNIWSAGKVCCGELVFFHIYSLCHITVYVYVYVCVCVCMRACMRACVRDYLHALFCRCLRKRPRPNFSGIWLIATLLINPAIHTSFSILRCPGVQKEDGRWMSVCMMLCMCFHIQVVVFMLWLQYCPSWLTIHSNNCANVEFP